MFRASLEKYTMLRANDLNLEFRSHVAGSRVVVAAAMDLRRQRDELRRGYPSISRASCTPAPSHFAQVNRRKHMEQLMLRATNFNLRGCIGVSRCPVGELTRKLRYRPSDELLGGEFFWHAD